MTIGVFTSKTDIFRAMKEHCDASEVVKMVFADPHYKDSLTKQMTEDPKELTKFVALDLLVSLVIYNQNCKRDKDLYVKLKPLIQSIFSINELYDKGDIEKYGKENDLFISENYTPTMKEIQDALTKEFLLEYIQTNIDIGELFDVETISKVIHDHYIKSPDDITQVKCGDFIKSDTTELTMYQ